jgi:1-acyl-sn-glycerol-3-phosphate acyltransferase
MKRETLQSILKFIAHAVARVEFSGAEHLPAEGGLIVATNHMSRVDTLLLFLNPARKDITALVADKYKKYPIFNWILNVGGIIWLDRDKADFGAFRLAADALKSGRALGIAPEGTRSQTGQLLEGKPGTVLLAQRANVPIVPVAIAGTEVFFRRLLTFRRPQVKITFGPAFTLPPLDRANRDESLRQMTEEIMVRIAVLLPPKYWGFYKDNPRLQEMLANKPQ